MPFYVYIKFRFVIKRPALQAKNHRRAMQISPLLAKASITIEAAMSLSLFLFTLYLLILPLNMLSTQRQMQALVEKAAEHAAQYIYAKNTFLPLTTSSDEEVNHTTSEEQEQIEKSGYYTSLLESGALAAYAQGLAMSEIQDRMVVGIHPLGTWCTLEDEMIYVKLNYDYKLPFGLFGVRSVKQSVQSAKRAWVGKDGIKKKDAKKEDEEMVYVGKTSTRYHLSATCHYLSNDISKVNIKGIATKTNKFGRHYTPCARCASGVTSGDVYIMPSGTSFHTTRSCSAINAYARKVPKSEVEHLGACSYCGGGH